MNRSTPEAYQLFHKGSIAFSQMEANGMRIDVPYLDNAIVEVGNRIKTIEAEMMEDDTWRQWKKRFGPKANLTSTAQLATLLFDHMGYESRGFTEKSADTDEQRYKADKDTFQHIDLPFVRKFTEASRLRKLHGTYLMGVRNETVNGWLHPVFHLHTTRSQRGAGADPNFQNIPTRIKEIAQWIRTAFIPRSKNHQIAEVDFVGAEVKVSYTYHKDRRMKSYLDDKSTDMHRDMAMQCFCIKDPDQITKDVRFTAKSFFTFAEFYGDYWLHVAQNMWDQIDLAKLKTKDGTGIKDILRKACITKLGSPEYPEKDSFFAHIRDVEQDFWGNRFSEYGQWKRDWYAAYQKAGGFFSHTGFWFGGIYSRNQSVNYPIQSASFHCLLWVLIELQNWLNKHRMKTRIIGQIHDSIVLDAHKDELQDVLHKIKRLVSISLPRAWPWIIVDLEIEAEVSPLGGTWFQKEAFVLNKNDVWVPAKGAA